MKLAYLVTALLFTSCSSFKSGPSFIDQEANNKITEMNTKSSELKMRKAHLITPNLFQEAKEVISDSKELLNEGKTFTDMQKEFNRFTRLEQEMTNSIEMSRRHVSQILEARDQAIMAGAKDRDLFREAESKFREVGESIEDKDLTDVIEQRSDVIKSYQLAEVEAIKNNMLLLSKKNLKEVKALDGDDYFPELYNESITHLEKAGSVISANKDDMVLINHHVRKAEDSSKRLIALTKTANWLEKTETSKMALSFEEDFTKVYNDLYAPYDARFLSAKQNFVNLKKETSYLPSVRSEIARLSKNNNILDNKVKEIMSREKRLNERVVKSEEIQRKISEFKKEVGSSNADVFRQGDAILVRLKGVNFDFNKSNLPKAAKPVMDEVVEFIDEFEKPRLIVEGHADAIGNPSYNKELSKARANNVLDFITKEAETNFASTKTIGYGFNKPIVDNRTASNRATNRRIDILIYPNS